MFQSLNPDTVYWMDIFHIPICCKICNVYLKRQKNVKENGLAHLKIIILEPKSFLTSRPDLTL